MTDEHPLGWRSPGRYVRESDDLDDQEMHQRAVEEYGRQSREQRDRLRAIEGRAEAMRYFDDVARYDGPRVKELQRAKEGGGHVVGTLCVFAPAEVIRAAGAEVVRLCSGQHHGVHPANELLGDAGLCPCVKSTLGGRLAGADLYMALADIIIAPASCDGKVKLGEILEDYLPVIMMNLPRVKTGDTTAKLWVEEVLYMMRELSRLTGVEVTASRLGRPSRRTTRPTTPCPGSTGSAGATAAPSGAGTPCWWPKWPWWTTWSGGRPRPRRSATSWSARRRRGS